MHIRAMIEETKGTHGCVGEETKIRDGDAAESDRGADDTRERPTTIDSLALKRARLPLQLVPIELENYSDENREMVATRRPSFKVRSSAEQRRRRGSVGRRSRSRHGRSATAERVERAILEGVAARRAESGGSGSMEGGTGSAEGDAYDDVGPPEPRDLVRNEEDEDYDDVGPPPPPPPPPPPSRIAVDRGAGSIEEDDGIYDDVGGPPAIRGDRSASSDNDYSSIDEKEDAAYDDVRAPSTTSHERVNSIYAGSELGSDPSGASSPRRHRGLVGEHPDETIRKGISGGSRGFPSGESLDEKRTRSGRTRRVDRRRSRLFRGGRPSGATPLGADDTDTASDDSNYETLFSSFPSDEFSSDAEDEGVPLPEALTRGEPGSTSPGPPVPSRPVPPPPRESSLTETFGRRMKMLRRTWSITKGSLGRMRRRAPSGNLEEGNREVGSSPERSNDARKYFRFTKRFGKRGLTGLSKFYLEREDALANNDRRSCPAEERVYSSAESSWYANTEYGTTDYRGRTGRSGDALEGQEPLYQFYTAATARIAFESDSEGYEEVVPTGSSGSSVLASTGRKSLWCHTSRVRSSGLLQRLGPEEKKCQEAKYEILTSETSYLNSLRVLVDQFLNNHELVHEILTPSERERLFGGVPAVLRASESLLADLEAVWREDPMLPGLPELLSNYARISSAAYVAYCSNQVGIDATLRELRNGSGSKFVEAISRIESRPACENLSLHSFLMLPMQRVTRLPLLADAVLSKLPADSGREERKSWEGALSELSRVVIECNEGARAAGRLVETEALERKLEYSPKVRPIALRDRYLIRRGPVIRLLDKSDADYRLTFGKRYHKTRLCLFLLTDHLLIAKPKSSANEETYVVIDSCKRNLLELERVDEEDSPFAGRNAVRLTLIENHLGRHVEYVLACESPTERERWLDAVSPPKPSLVGESLYETWDCPQVMVLYPYAAAQPDELSVQPGEVINVLRKMSDGWHLGEKLLGGEQGWFPGNYAKEVASEHVRAKNLRQRHRLLALSTSVLQQRAKRTSR